MDAGAGAGGVRQRCEEVEEGEREEAAVSFAAGCVVASGTSSSIPRRTQSLQQLPVASACERRATGRPRREQGPTARTSWS